MNNKSNKHTMCKDCKGLGYIKTLSETFVQCIICNSLGTTTHGPNGMNLEAEQVLLYKIAWDFIHGKQKGWYH